MNYLLLGGLGLGVYLLLKNKSNPTANKIAPIKTPTNTAINVKSTNTAYVSDSGYGMGYTPSPITYQIIGNTGQSVIDMNAASVFGIGGING